MMLRKADRDAVYAAADELAASKQKVTNAAIVAAVGGSNSTVGPLLKEWRDARADAPDAPEPVPPMLASLLASVGTRAWAEARAAADARYDGERARAVTRAKGDAVQIAELSAALDERDAQLDTIAAELAAAKDALAVANTAALDTVARAAHAEGRAAALADEVARLHRDRGWSGTAGANSVEPDGGDVPGREPIDGEGGAVAVVASAKPEPEPEPEPSYDRSISRHPRPIASAGMDLLAMISAAPQTEATAALSDAAVNFDDEALTA